MNEVKALFTVQPWLSEVVDLESQIGGNHRGLGGAEVGAEYLYMSGGFWASLTCRADLACGKLIGKVAVCYSLVFAAAAGADKRLTLPKFLQGQFAHLISRNAICIPVPVPRSKTCCAKSDHQYKGRWVSMSKRTMGGFVRGARYNSPSRRRRQMWWLSQSTHDHARAHRGAYTISSCSACVSSLGPPART